MLGLELAHRSDGEARVDAVLGQAILGVEMGDGETKSLRTVADDLGDGRFEPKSTLGGQSVEDDGETHEGAGKLEVAHAFRQGEENRVTFLAKLPVAFVKPPVVDQARDFTCEPATHDVDGPFEILVT